MKFGERERESRLTESITLFVEKYYDKIFITVLSVLFIHLFIQCNHHMSDDVNSCIKPWYLHFAENGLGGFKTIYSQANADYPPLYLFLLALLSYLPHPSNGFILFYVKFLAAFSLFIIATYTYKIIFDYSKNKVTGLISFAVVLFSPLAIINSLIWGQADLLYAACTITALYYLFKERYFLAFILLGFSLAFKTMGVFILPFVLVYTASKSIPIRHYFLLPIPHIFFAILSALFGAPFGIALKQLVRSHYYLTANAPNFGSILLANHPLGTIHYSLYYVTLTLAFVFFLIYFYFFIINRKKIKWDWDTYLLWATVSCLAAPFFLPHMHERYFTLAEILSILYAFTVPKYFYIPIIINIASLSPYVIALLSSIVFPLHYAGLMMMFGLILLVRILYLETVKNS